MDTIVVQHRVRTLTFWEFKDCGAPKLFGKKDPISSRWWIADIESAQRKSFCPDGPKARFASCIFEGSRARLVGGGWSCLRSRGR